MRGLPLILGGAVLFTGFLVSPGQPQDRTPKRAASALEEEKKAKAILDAAGPTHAAKAYSELFKAATEKDLRRLQMHPSDTIAIQAAWEEVERTLPTNPEQVVRPARDRLARFLGFLEGRARVQAPAWWEEALLDARANRRGNVYAGGLNIAERRARPNAVAPPRQATFDKEGGQPVVRVGSVAAAIPEDLREKLRVGGVRTRLSALITPSRCYIAAYDSVGYPYRLACVERSSQTVRWVADVWASWWGGTTGSHWQWVEVAEQSSRVVVFGVSSTGFHVEGFRVKDGLNVFRFSNSYSG
jgi:hypothetical protein